MPVETNGQATTIDQLKQEYPLDGDLIKEGDDHIRMIKKVLKSTFAKFTSPVTMSSDKLSQIDSNFDVTATSTTVKTALVATANSAGSSANNWDLKGVKILNMGGTTGSNTNTKNDFTAATIGDIFRFAQQQAWPVGSIYMSTNGTNPSNDSVLGFGTWIPFAQGQAVFGVNGSDFQLSTTGGAKTVTLTQPQMPVHSHAAGGLSGATSGAGGHYHLFPGDDGLGSWAQPENTALKIPYDADSDSHPADGRMYKTTTVGDHSHTFTVGGSVANAGSGQAHENMPPYRCAYYFTRTA